MSKDEFNRTLANPITRSVAFLFDYVVLTFIVTASVFTALGSDFWSGGDESKMNVIKVAIAIPALLLCFAKDSIVGISPGKWIFGIKVQNASDENAPFFDKLFIRNLPLIFLPVELLIMVLNTDRKRFGDRIAKTVVVKNTSPTNVVLRLVVLIIVIAALIYGFKFFSAMEKNAQR